MEDNQQEKTINQEENHEMKRFIIQSTEQQQLPISNEEMDNIDFSDNINLLKTIKKVCTYYLEGELEASLLEQAKTSIEEIAISFSLKCALTNERLTQPARTTGCTHRWAIEMRYFVSLQSCPCGKSIQQYGIITDKMFLTLLKLSDYLYDTASSELKEINHEKQIKQDALTSSNVGSDNIVLNHDSQLNTDNNSGNQEDEDINQVESIMMHGRSKLFFPCFNEIVYPLPKFVFKDHIFSPSKQEPLNYFFQFKAETLLNENAYDMNIRICRQSLCLCSFEQLDLSQLEVECPQCKKYTDMFNLEVDNYIIQVKVILAKKLITPEEKQQVIAMQNGKFKINGMLFSPQKINLMVKE